MQAFHNASIFLIGGVHFPATTLLFVRLKIVSFTGSSWKLSLTLWKKNKIWWKERRLEGTWKTTCYWFLFKPFLTWKEILKSNISNATVLIKLIDENFCAHSKTFHKNWKFFLHGRWTKRSSKKRQNTAFSRCLLFNWSQIWKKLDPNR